MLSLFKGIALFFFLIFGLFWLIGVLVVALIGAWISIAWKNSKIEVLNKENKK